MNATARFGIMGLFFGRAFLLFPFVQLRQHLSEPVGHGKAQMHSVFKDRQPFIAQVEAYCCAAQRAAAAYDMDIVCIESEGDLQACDPSPYEVVAWLSDRIISTDYWWNTPWGGGNTRALAAVWDALAADGWRPTDTILEVRDACGRVGA